MNRPLPFAAPAIVAVLRVADAETAVWAGTALAAGGVHAVEVPTTVGEGWCAAISALAERLPGVAVGAGTVTSAMRARAAVEAGAAFVVSPVLELDVVTTCLELGAPIVPGAATPTEIVTAVRTGAAAVKVFPAGVLGGPEYFRALADPLPGLPLLPSGGVRLANVRDYLGAGAIGVIVGTPLLPPDAVARRDADALTHLGREYVAALEDAGG